MARPLALNTVFANLAGTQPASLIDGDLNQIVSAINDPASYSNYAVDSGAVNALAATFSPPVTSLVAGLALQVKVLNTNTGASTLNANGTGAKNIVQQSGSALIAGQLTAGGLLSVIYDGTNYVMISASGAVTNVVSIAFAGYLGQTGSTQLNAAPSNLQVFTAPPPTLVQGAGTVSSGVGGALLLTFAAAHGLREGEAVQFSSTVTLPGNISASTTYIVHLPTANPTTTINIYAVPTGWQYMVPLITAASPPAGVTFGALIAFSTTGSGTLTASPGWVAPSGVTRARGRGVAGGSGGGGATTNTASGGGGAAGEFSESFFAVVGGTFYSMVVGAGGAGGTAGGGAGVIGGATSFFGISLNPGAATGGGELGSLGGATGSGATVDIAGGDGHPGVLAAGNTLGGTPGASRYGGGGRAGYSTLTTGNARAPGSGGGGGGASAGAQEAGSNGASGIIEIEW